MYLNQLPFLIDSKRNFRVMKSSDKNLPQTRNCRLFPNSEFLPYEEDALNLSWLTSENDTGQTDGLDSTIPLLEALISFQSGPCAALFAVLVDEGCL